MNYKKIWILLLDITLLLSLAGCMGPVELLHINKEPIAVKVTQNDVKNIILSAARRRGWVTKQISNGEIQATYTRRKYMAKVNIFYNTRSYTIRYVDSKNLKYDGQKIHRKYNSLIHSLRKQINYGFRRLLKRGKVEKREIPPVTKPVETAPPVLYAKASEPTYQGVTKQFGNTSYTFKKSKSENINSYALIIGISRYKQNPDVPYADTSARAFADLVNITFGVPKENIILLLNENASSGELKAKFEIIKELADRDGNLYIYYAGHGVPSKKGDAYILPYDMSADAMYLEPNLKLKNIYAKLSKLKVKNVFIFIDSCFSGKDDSGRLLYKGVAPVLRAKKTTVNTKKLTVFAASKSSEFANEYQDKGQRMFTYYLIDELSKGQTKLNKVYPKIKQEVKRKSLKKGIGYKQIPQIYGNDKVKLY